MSTAAETVQRLRGILAEKFGSPAPPKHGVLETGLYALDSLSIPLGAITEIVAPSGKDRRGGSVTLLLYTLLQKWLVRSPAVLIDGRDAFDPKSLPQESLNRLLWLRCQSANEAIKAADLVIRDGNFPLVILLMVLNNRAEMKRVTVPEWHRLQILAEKSGVTLLVFTKEISVPGVQLRLSLKDGFPLSDLHRLREDLTISLRTERRKMGLEKEPL